MMARSKFITGSNAARDEFNRRIQAAFLEYLSGNDVMKNLTFITTHLEHGTNQWSDKTDENVIHFKSLCPNLCLYCYAAANSTAKFGVNTRTIFEDLKEKGCDLFSFSKCDHPDMERIRPKMVIDESKLMRRTGTPRRPCLIMLPSSHDLFPELLDHEIEIKTKAGVVVKHSYVAYLKRLIDAGNELLITTKPRFDVTSRLCEELKECKDKIVFRFTITSADDKINGFWESFAPSFDERVRSLEHARMQGFKTTISMEPFLTDPEEVIQRVSPLVSQIWIGYMSKMAKTRLLGHDVEAGSELHSEIKRLEELYKQESIMALVEKYKDNPKIMWKSSVIFAMIDLKKRGK